MISSYTDADVFYGIALTWGIAPPLLLIACVATWHIVDRCMPCFRVSDLEVKIKSSCIALLAVELPGTTGIPPRTVGTEYAHTKGINQPPGFCAAALASWTSWAAPGALLAALGQLLGRLGPLLAAPKAGFVEKLICADSTAFFHVFWDSGV